ncbi:restriction endonuclease subunit S [Salinimicrobium terrae]|uniref:restriction endonuclease subunit S n=1 Tax=Salinimicrobium terrae TaxID=470866 RepID=UPI0003FBD2A4|nr:restriction endonuclease subunit S [Salinimicrobium terrae]
MPENWKTYNLEDLVTKLGDGIHGTPKYSEDGEYHFINGNNLVDGKIVIKSDTKRVTTAEYLKHKRELNDRTLLVSINGTIGKTAYYHGEKVMLGKSACYFNVKEGVNKKFIKHVISSKYFLDYLESNYTGSVIKNVSLKSMRELPINLPPLQEQKSIASILSALDDKIELNLQINKTLEEMAMALYKHWFVDFGPFQDGEFVESELGEIPKGWEVKPLGEFIQHQKGFAFKSKWYQEAGKMVVRVSDTTDNSINIDSCNKISEEMASDYLRYSLKTNDIIVATVGSWPPNFSSVVGKIVRVPPTAENALLNQNAVKLNMAFNGKEQQGLLYTTLKLDRFLNYIVNCAQGSANQASIKLTDIFNFPIPYSANAKLDSYKIQVDNYITLQNSNILENQTLTQLRDTLLPKLISGEVRVKDVEKTLSEVL